MQEERDLVIEEEDKQTESTMPVNESPETAEYPVSGIKHEHEPDAENIMPVKDRPGTF